MKPDFFFFPSASLAMTRTSDQTQDLPIFSQPLTVSKTGSLRGPLFEATASLF